MGAKLRGTPGLVLSLSKFTEERLLLDLGNWGPRVLREQAEVRLDRWASFARH